MSEAGCRRSVPVSPPGPLGPLGSHFPPFAPLHDPTQALQLRSAGRGDALGRKRGRRKGPLRSRSAVHWGRDPAQNFSGFDLRTRARKVRGCGRALGRGGGGARVARSCGGGARRGARDPGATGRAVWGSGRNGTRARARGLRGHTDCSGGDAGARAPWLAARRADSPGGPGWRLLRLRPSCFSWQPLRGS